MKWMLPPLLVLAFLGAACGSPYREPKEFVFTPAPYTPLPERIGTPPCGGNKICNYRGIGVTESGGEYYADQVFLHAREGEVGRTLRFLDSYGWEVIGQSEFDETSIVIRVPLGGAPDIARFLSEQPFIEQASPHGILRTQ